MTLLQNTKTIMLYFKAHEICDKLNADPLEDWTYKIIALPDLKAYIEIWNDEYFVGTF